MAFKKTSTTKILAGIATIATTTVKSSPIAQTHQIFWDSSNDLFQSERNPTKQVRLGDRLDFTCGDDIGNAYLVNDFNSFRNCDTSSRNKQVLFNCEKPATKKSIKLLEVNPHPLAPIFTAGKNYYLVGGSCTTGSNLRLIIKIDQEVSSDGLPRVVTDEIDIIQKPELEEIDIKINPETPRVVVPIITTSGSSELSEQPPDFSANNAQLNQLLIGVAIGVLIFLVLVFSSILIYLKFCSSSNKKSNNKVSDVENSSESGIGYTFKQAPVINTMYQNRPPTNSFYQTIHHQSHIQNQIQNQTLQHHYQNSNYRRQKPTQTQTYTNIPLSRQIVGEPSMTGNAFLSIAKRVDPAYAHDISQELDNTHNHKFDSMDSGKDDSRENDSSRGSSEPLLNPIHHRECRRDIGYEGSQECPDTGSSQASPQSGFKSCQPRLENGGLVISV